MEGAGISGEILDAGLRIVFISSEEARIVGVEPEEVDRFYGKSLVTRQLEDPEVWGISDESSRRWWRQNVPIMRHYLEPDDPRFEQCFGPLAEAAARVEPVDPPRAWHSINEFPSDLPLRRTVLGDVTFLEMRIDDAEGRFLGFLRFSRNAVPDSLLSRLGRGDLGLFRRMDNVREPTRRPAAILFADLEASGSLSRRLSSRGYFGLISGLTDLIDSAVVARNGIVGKHAGDGASALFLVADLGDSESAAVRAAIEAARAIRDGAAGLGPDEVEVRVNIGLHWGSLLGAPRCLGARGPPRGRLEVTALGDQMNECARIEAAAGAGSVLASKELIERLAPDDALAAGVDPESISYTPLGEREGAGEKAARDAGAIPVAEI
jgi:class 3 adenylate cyclase